MHRRLAHRVKILVENFGAICYKNKQNVAIIFGILTAFSLLQFPLQTKRNTQVMLTINVGKGDVTSVLRYFKEGLVKQGNYYHEKDVIAHWHGITSKYLGLEGKEVTEEAFARLADNKHHITKDRITPRDGENRRSVIDFTFSAPKSVSILEAFTKDPAILKAHETGYKAAMAEVEAMMHTQNNTQYARGYTLTGNIIYAAFNHDLARPVKVQRENQTFYLAEKQRHTHCVMPAFTFNPKTNRYEAVETFTAHSNAPYIQAVYNSVLSYELEKAGYQIERRVDGFFEVAGIPRDVIERFSSRTLEIEKIAKEKGITGKAKGELGAKTRSNKSSLTLTEEQLYEEWKSRLTLEEFQNLLSLKGKSFAKPAPISAKEAIDRSLEHFLERNSVANEKRVIAHALTLGFGYLTNEQVTEELNSRDNILRSEKDTLSIITTKEKVIEEDYMIDLAVSAKGIHRAANKDYEAKQDFLNEQQRNTIKDVLSSTDGVMIVRGSAGVGKTTTQISIRDGLKEAQKELLAVAPSSQASKVLAEKGLNSDTISGLLTNPEQQEKLQDNWLLVDEAGMVGVQGMNEILELGKKHNARIILSADTKQHHSVMYGDAHRILETQAGLQVSTMNKIVRQKPEKYRSAVEDIAKGKVLQGYQKLDKQDAVKEISDHEERIEKIAKDYVDELAQNRSVITVSPTHFEGDKINEAVRNELKSRGRIQGEEKVFDVLKDASLTESQRKDIVSYTPGQVVRFTKYVKGGFVAGSHHQVTEVTKDNQVKVRDLKTGKTSYLPYQSPEHYGVYNKNQIVLAKGDRIRLTNNAIVDGSKLNNGTSYSIRGFEANGIVLSNGKVVPSDLFHMRYAYCSTSHSAQGKDAHTVLLSMSDLSQGGINEQSFYVGVSRGTKHVAIYCSDKDELKKAIQRSGERQSAREVAQDHQQRLLERKQIAHHKNLNQKPYERIQGREKTTQRGISQEFTNR